MLKRRAPLRAKSPLSARKPMQKRRRKQSAAQKESRFRSPAYLAFVRSLPCCACGAKADSAHHLTGLWNLSGMGLKAPDSFVLPVCDGPGGCHAQIHASKQMQWMQPIWLIETINAGLGEYPAGPIHDALLEAQAFVIEKREAE